MITPKDYELLKECNFDYLMYKCHKSIELSSKANGSSFDINTSWLESFFLELRNETGFSNVHEVITFIKEITGKDIWEGWISPGFVMTYFC